MNDQRKGFCQRLNPTDAVGKLIEANAAPIEAAACKSMWPWSASVLAFCGTILMAIGLYFVFLRPPLLPEDARFMGTTLSALHEAVPGLFDWLLRVFWVMGGYMFATGLLTLYVACTTFRARARGSAAISTLAGATSIGLMAVVNFTIDSDFKWMILSFAIPWVFALALYRFERRDSRKETLSKYKN